MFPKCGYPKYQGFGYYNRFRIKYLVEKELYKLGTTADGQNPALPIIRNIS